MFNVNVKTSNENDGCFSKSFKTLDEVRVFIKSSAASFRSSSRNPSLACTALIVRNGTSISAGHTVAC